MWPAPSNGSQMRKSFADSMQTSRQSKLSRKQEGTMKRILILCGALALPAAVRRLQTTRTATLPSRTCGPELDCWMLK